MVAGREMMFMERGWTKDMPVMEMPRDRARRMYNNVLIIMQYIIFHNM
jgi:hypothetical protein